MLEWCSAKSLQVLEIPVYAYRGRCQQAADGECLICKDMHVRVALDTSLYG